MSYSASIASNNPSVKFSGPKRPLQSLKLGIPLETDEAPEAKKLKRLEDQFKRRETQYLLGSKLEALKPEDSFTLNNDTIQEKYDVKGDKGEWYYSKQPQKSALEQSGDQASGSSMESEADKFPVKIHLYTKDVPDFKAVRAKAMPFLIKNGISHKFPSGLDNDLKDNRVLVDNPDETKQFIESDKKGITIYTECKSQFKDAIQALDEELNTPEVAISNSSIENDIPYGESGRVFFRSDRDLMNNQYVKAAHFNRFLRDNELNWGSLDTDPDFKSLIDQKKEALSTNKNPKDKNAETLQE